MPRADDFDEFYATTSRRLVGQLFAMTGDLNMLYACHMTTDKQIIRSPVVFRLDQESGVPTYLQLVHQVEHALRLGYLKVGDQLPKVRDVVTALTIHPNTVLKAYKELEAKGLAAGRPGQGTFITGTLEPVTLPELAGLRRGLVSWLKAAGEAGLDEAGVAALLANVTRDYYGGRAAKAENENAGNEGVA